LVRRCTSSCHAPSQAKLGSTREWRFTLNDRNERVEEISVSGEKLLSTIKELVHQGNIRRITVKNRDGATLIEIPLTVGVVGILLLPTVAALGAIAALVTECTILIERFER